MARKTKKEMLARAQDPAAPYLFDEEDLPVRNDLVQAVREQRYQHTGARLLDNEKMVLRLVELLMARWGLRKIARTLHVSKHSVKAARDALVAQGKLAPFKERVVAVFEEIVEVGASSYLRDLEDGLVAPAQKPVGAAIFWDKRALAMGEPTTIGVAGQVQLDQKSLSVEALNAWRESLPADLPLSGSPTKPKKIEALSSAEPSSERPDRAGPGAGEPTGPAAGAGSEGDGQVAAGGPGGGSAASAALPGPTNSGSGT